MKRYQSGAEKRKKLKRNLERSVNEKNSMLKFLTTDATSSLQSNSFSENAFIASNECKNKESVDNEVTGIDETASELDFRALEDKSNQFPESSTYSDIALWPNITDSVIDYVILNKPENVGDIDTLKSLYTDRDRSYFRGLSQDNFYRIKSNGNKEKRNWLVFSETSKCVYCYPCKLFSTSKSKLISGFQNWKNISATLCEHETSKEHMSSMCKLYKRSSNINKIDTNILQQKLQEQNYWKEVLKRVISTIKLISRLGLAFRGHDESQNSSRRGNYITCLEYLSEYDEFLKLHLERYGNKGRGNTNYLSSHTCDEFIMRIRETVKASIIEQIKSANYYSIILDSTPDISHVDQLTIIIRYVSQNGVIKERFLGFIPIEQHTSAHLEEKVLKFLKEMDIDIKLCRGQSYDNASNMAGQYTGVQARIKEHSPSAIFIPCSAHSLNLVGNFAAESCSVATSYFMFVQKLFVFFSASTHRWQTLNKHLENCKDSHTVNKISDTRWLARADAVIALKIGYKEILAALSEIKVSQTEKKKKP